LRDKFAETLPLLSWCSILGGKDGARDTPDPIGAMSESAMGTLVRKDWRKRKLVV